MIPLLVFQDSFGILLEAFFELKGTVASQHGVLGPFVRRIQPLYRLPTSLPRIPWFTPVVCLNTGAF